MDNLVKLDVIKLPDNISKGPVIKISLPVKEGEKARALHFIPKGSKILEHFHKEDSEGYSFLNLSSFEWNDYEIVGPQMTKQNHAVESREYIEVVFGVKKGTDKKVWQDSKTPDIKVNSIAQNLIPFIPKSNFIEFVISPEQRLYCISDGKGISFLQSIEEKDSLKTHYNVYAPLSEGQKYDGENMKDALNNLLFTFLNSQETWQR